IGDQLGRIGRHWGWLLFFGILMVAAGVAAVAWPGPTVVVLAILFGIQIIVSGIFSFINAFAADESGGMRVWNVILGLLGIVIGLYAVRHIIVSVVALALLIGIYWVAYGIAQIYAAIAHRELPHRGWMGFTGALSVVAGIIVIAWPGPSLVTLAIVLGVWLIIYGVMEIALAFQVRSAISHVRHAVTSPA
ncbi:MAG TPA: HdeD family acid-resistance protein, partial [Streptosporangiaceae bacterium]|nr:HdeD family acid-resistance protein [Streptosporangiaceae bacterium]